MSFTLYEIRVLCETITRFEGYFMRSEENEIHKLTGSLMCSSGWDDQFKLNLFRGWRSRTTGLLHRQGSPILSLGYGFFQVFRDGLERLYRYQKIREQKECEHEETGIGSCEQCRTPKRP